MSQSRISRIESGRQLPTVVDVDRILKALEVPAESAAELLALTRKANVEHTSWRAVAEIGIWRKQAELTALAESCQVQRQFLPSMLCGLLQVPEYARVALSPMVDTDPDRNIDRALEVRLERQKVLEDESRTFIFLLAEQAVYWRHVERPVMARQCEHLANVAQRPNVDLHILPISAGVPAATLCTYMIYDNRLVVAELISGEVALYDPKDIDHHRSVFDYYLKHSLGGSRATAFLLAARDEFM
ncbi:hypothetical protein EV191_108219 [Tamaricihabitans halophyticus]|uniref:HTH cro/C1-type domain-containing protein n=2 Tax=Tamaricihabitans halophyticus TaxID=1262583 RepID=A0A4R2QKY7_9PSEU|nr:hypothetical protein EV191_108219 [Tamaricihabitans halophyticus]